MARRAAPFVAAFAAGLLVAGLAAPACPVGDRACAAVADEADGAVGLLQRGAKAGDVRLTAPAAAKAAVRGRRQTPNSTQVWSELKAAVEIDQLQAAIQNATNSETAKELQGQLTQLQSSFPTSTEELKQEFSAQWENITKAMEMENIQEQLNEAYAAGSEEVEVLQKQLESLQMQLGNVSLESIQSQATDTWSYLQDQGVPLPDLDNLTASAEELANQALETANEAYDSLSNALNSTYDAATDAVNDITSSVQDALGGLFR